MLSEELRKPVYQKSFFLDWVRGFKSKPDFSDLRDALNESEQLDTLLSTLNDRYDELPRYLQTLSKDLLSRGARLSEVFSLQRELPSEQSKKM